MAKISFNFDYVAIRIDQFASFKCSADTLKNERTFDGSISPSANYKEQTVEVKVLSNLKLGNELVMTIRTTSLFRIELASWESLQKDSDIVIPLEILWHLAGLAVSTTRGIIFAKTEDTAINQFILPTLRIDKIITNELRIPIQNKDK